MTINIAHVCSNSGEIQTLEDHLSGVAELASEFMAPLELESSRRLIGLLHDLGKASQVFNDYIRGKGDHLRGETILQLELSLLKDVNA